MARSASRCRVTRDDHMILTRTGFAVQRWMSATGAQVGLLAGLDAATNLTDYGFHAFLGRALAPGDFAIVQSVNALLLIVVTACAVMQPVVARYVAAGQSSDPHSARGRALFQSYFWQSGLVGLILMVPIWYLRRPIGDLLNVPAAAVSAASVMIWFALVRPVVAGMLQGQQQFASFGLTRLSFALGRLGLAVLMIGFLGGGAVAGVSAIPLGALLALILGLALLGRTVWKPGAALPRSLYWDGWRLSIGALLAYTSFMALMNSDIIWINRSLSGEQAASYATTVVLRRVMAVLPGAVLVVLYPKIVARVAQGGLPDKLLARSAAIIIGADIVVAAVYVLFGPQIVNLVFGPNYPLVGPLLGWMAVGMIGYGITAIWLNLFLATRPWRFVGILVAAATVQALMFAGARISVQDAIYLFVSFGWILALGGLVLYVAWLRPALERGIR